MVGDPGPKKLPHLSKIKVNLWESKKSIKKNDLKIKDVKSK
jgi:hypothetical protein